MPKAVQGENFLPHVNELKASSLFNVESKVCVVTGGGSGIGAMIATGLIDNGAKVYIASRKDISDFASTLTSRGGGKCIALKVDLSKDESVVEFAKEVGRLEPAGVDILINNSGTNWNEKIDTHSMQGWDKVYTLNTRAVFFLTQQFIPLLTKKGTKEDPSRVVNISSIAGEKVHQGGTFAYNSGKAATTHLSKHMAVHLAARNVTVNALCPGYFPSRMTRETLSKLAKQTMNKIPLQRYGNIKDMVSLALYLCGKGGAWVTGQKFILDGGETLGIRYNELSNL